MELKYCESCINNLKTLDVTFDLYQNICECYVLEGKPFSLSNLGIQEFSLMALENKGFLVTTEDDIASVTVKPLGISLLDECAFVCPGICIKRSQIK